MARIQISGQSLDSRFVRGMLAHGARVVQADPIVIEAVGQHSAEAEHIIRLAYCEAREHEQLPPWEAIARACRYFPA